MNKLDEYLLTFLDSPVNVVALGVAGIVLGVAWLFRKEVLFYLSFIVKSLRRNLLRSALTAIATLVLVFVVTLVWTVLYFLDLVTSEKTRDFKVIVTERWQIPSQMPWSYATVLERGGARKEGEIRPDDSMTWQFFMGTLDKEKRTRENLVFFFGMNPAKMARAQPLPNKEFNQWRKLEAERSRVEKVGSLGRWMADPRKGGQLQELRARKKNNEEEVLRLSRALVEQVLNRQTPDASKMARLTALLDGETPLVSMMDGLEEMTATERCQLYIGCRIMERDRRAVIVGKDRLKAINKQVGETFSVSGINYMGIDLELNIIGVFPEGRYNLSALLSADYINESLEAYKRKTGKAHPIADKSLNLVWLRVPDSNAFREIAEQIMRSPEFTSPAVKSETASSGISSFLDAYRDLLWGMRWLMVPAILITMALVIANAISISVRERRTEMAVLKVLGFSPTQIMVLVLGEALLVGVSAGLLSAGGAILLINGIIGGIPFPIAFFPAFKIPMAALWWGPAMGAITAFAGSFFPALSARSVKVSEVFSKVA